MYIYIYVYIYIYIYIIYIYICSICSFALFTKIKKGYFTIFHFSAYILYTFSIKIFLTLRSGSFPGAFLQQ